MKWVTRKRVKVDRVACPWLIRRFVDPEVEFLFVEPEQVMETASSQKAIPFDVPDVELGHHQGRCTFEAIVEKYGLQDPALALMARIVHGADVSKDQYGRPEAAGLKAIAQGFSWLGLSDPEILLKEFPLYDALFAYCSREQG